MRALTVTAVVLALLGSGCGDPSAQPSGSNVAAPVESTATTTATIPPTAPSSTPMSAPATPAPRAQTADPCQAADMPSLEIASRCLIGAVVAGDRGRAARFATPDSVAWAFNMRSSFAELRFDSCDPPARGETNCYYTAGGRLFTFTGGDWSAGEDGNPSGYIVSEIISTRGTPPS